MKQTRGSSIACAAVLLAGAVSSGCAGPLSNWAIERAEGHLEAGRPERALRITERALQRHRDRPDPRELALHSRALRKLGRHVDAHAFDDYVERSAGGKPVVASDADRRECTGGQEGAEVVTGWGRSTPRGHELGTVAARFEVTGQGRIVGTRVLQARNPAAAWWIIDAVSGAKISSARLLRHHHAVSRNAPLPLCAWFELGGPESREVQIPEGGCIRGFCTNAPGTPPHM